MINHSSMFLIVAISYEFSSAFDHGVCIKINSRFKSSVIKISKKKLRFIHHKPIKLLQRKKISNL